MKTITTLVIAGLLLVSSPVFAEGVTSASVHEATQVDETPSSPEEGSSHSSSGGRSNRYLINKVALLQHIVSLLEQLKALQGK